MKTIKNFFRKMNAKLEKAENKAMAVVGGLGLQTGAGFCTKGVNAMGQTVMSIIFNGILYVGLAVTVAGIIMLVRCIMAVSGGDQLQPGQLGKAIGMTIGGIICVAAGPIIKAITGVDPNGVTLVPGA